MLHQKNEKLCNSRAEAENFAEEIVSSIFDQTRSKNTSLKVINFGARSHNFKSTTNDDTTTINEVWMTERFVDSRVNSTTQKLVDFVQNLISQEMRERTCTSLSPDLFQFLQWMMKSNVHVLDVTKAAQTEPKVKRESLQSAHIPTQVQNLSSGDPVADLDKWHRVAGLLNSLLEDYEGLSPREKRKIHAVHEYLVKI
ncbi:hypothetical protein QAD02_020269 [Eretmocerus hayati]|uniref:Uncharacterized protein n=1 Tax=Eretmocerus hayati TaxID=131215 RepID=A0ACC2PQ60_9HYME|nr:hypothetical protein QAD02_020269 [Eretmocerus hayati]